jgi:hypothetical protein
VAAEGQGPAGLVLPAVQVGVREGSTTSPTGSATSIRLGPASGESHASGRCSCSSTSRRIPASTVGSTTLSCWSSTTCATSSSTSVRSSRKSWDNIEAEMSKCKVVCANCHRRRTARRRGAFRVVLTESGGDVERAGDGNRTRDRSLEGSRVTATPRPRESQF